MTTSSIHQIGYAQHCLLHGDVRGALAVYKELVEANPDDMRMQERVAQLLREDGQLDAARVLYRLIARHWEAANFNLRALTLYKTLVELDPGDWNAKRHLAELYAALFFVDESRALYRSLADAFALQGNVKRRLAMLRNAADLGPEDVNTWLQLAVELDEAGFAEEAAERLAGVCDQLALQENWQRFLNVAQRYLERCPEDEERRQQFVIAESLVKDRASGGRAAARSASNDTAPASGDFRRIATTSSTRVASDAQLDRELELLFQQGKTDDSVLFVLPTLARDALVPGEAGIFGQRPFGPSSELLLKEPGHVVAAALRARQRGDAVLALALLEDEAAAKYPHATAYEKALAHFARQQWGECFDILLNVMDDAALAPIDQALVAYYLGLSAEMTNDTTFARVCWERVAALAPGDAPDVAARLAALAQNDGQ